MSGTPPLQGRPDAARQPERWEPEDEVFWASHGKRLATRNLWLSIPNLLCGFAVWVYWSIITAKMRDLGFTFDPNEQQNKQLFYTLVGIAGLSGATLRIPNSFLIAICGGRNVIAVTSLLLMIPAAGVGLALRDIHTTYGTFVALAALSGIGGGAFASSMSNISFFFPKRMQGLALGLNAGLGNLGVSVAQILLPWVMTFGLFGSLGGAALRLPRAASGAAAGTPVWIQNGGLVWVPILLVLAVLAWIGMTNLSQHRSGATPVAIARMMWLLMLGGLGVAAGVWLRVGMNASIWIALPCTVVVTMLALKFLAPAQIRPKLAQQFAIFRAKHNWVMTWLYVMTFGSFIGYSQAFPNLIKDVFGQLPGGAPNPQAPNAMAYAWLGPLVGSLVRPVGGWLSDRFGGARITQWDTVAMICAALGVAWCVKQAGSSSQPADYFPLFIGLFLVLFITTGIGNGSTFRMIPIIFRPEQAGPVLGWTSAVAAYGACIIPEVFGAQIKARTPEYALYGFAIYYVTCLFVNWWFYVRKHAEIPC